MIQAALEYYAAPGCFTAVRGSDIGGSDVAASDAPRAVEVGDEPSEEALEACDEVAALTVDPDSAIDEVRRRYERDPGFHMDGTVFNVERGAFESVATGRTGG